MLFYFGPSVARSALAGDQATIDFLSRALDSRKRGQLLLLASKRTLQCLQDAMSAAGRAHESQLLATLGKNFREVRQIVRDLSRLIYVSTLLPGYREVGGTILLAGPAALNKSNLHAVPIMLGENLTDCELYVNAIAKNFTVGVPESIRGLRLAERFENGGGNTTHTVYRRHKRRAEDLCICIVDSDRNCPEEDLGDTAKSVVSVDAKSKSPLCEVLVVDAYSAENLLPIEEIERQFVVGKGADDIKKFQIAKKFRETVSWRYLALKKGVAGKDLKGKNARAKYWAETLTQAKVKIPCCDQEKCSCIILPAINSKTLANAVSPEQMNWPTLLNQEPNEGIRADYLRISIMLRSWLCVGREIRL